MKTIAIMAFLVVGSAAHALILDDFVDGNTNSSIFAGTGATYDAATVPGGFRYTEHTIESSPLGLTHSNIVVNGIFASDSKTLVDAIAKIAWGVDNNGIAGAGTDLNANLSSFGAFKINILSNDLPATIQLGVRSNSGSFVNSSVYNVAPGMIMMNQSITINFSDFGGVDFSDVDAISMVINTSASGDIVIDSFEAVPEPASMIALGLGAAALVARRKRNS